MSGAELRSMLRQLCFSPAVGMYTIYELARTFLRQDHEKRGQHLFSILHDLEPSIVPSTNELLFQEVVRLRRRSAVLPFWNTLNQAATRSEIYFLSRANADDARRFISKRQNKIKQTRPSICARYIEDLQQYAQTDIRLRSVRTFEDMYHYYEYVLSDYIIAILSDVIAVSSLEATEICHRLDDFPAIRSLLKANIYAGFILFRYKRPPAPDFFDDIRHLINSSYQEYFVTDDGILMDRAEQINSSLIIIPWKALHVS